MTRYAARGFSLVELLIVVTIIIVLLALLAPALDKAVYQAQLAVCGARLKAIAQSGTDYAMNYQRHYPDTGQQNHNPQPCSIGSGPNPLIANQDRRPVLREALGALNRVLDDPLTAADLELDNSNAEWVFANDNLFFGQGWDGEKPLKRIGDRFSWIQRSADPSLPPVPRSSTCLASDRDVVQLYSQSQSSHPDARGLLTFLRLQDQPNPWWLGPVYPVTVGLWWNASTAERGATDDNFAMGDVSVVRYNAVAWNGDERLARIPDRYGPDANQAVNWFMYLPK